MSSPTGKIPFLKPWCSYSDQLGLLQQRGLVISDRAFAEQFLSHLNYYRFSGYCLAFETRRHDFIPGVTFEQIVDAYQFDLVLRDLITEALEAIEVDIRATVAYCFGRRYGAFGHVDSNRFFFRFNHREWLDRLHEEAERSSELFIKHFAGAYKEFPDLPIWMVTEVMSFGGLSKMVDGMVKRDQKEIALRYRLQPDTLISWMHHLVYVRNLCAHHSRLWDRIWSIKPERPAAKIWQPPYVPGNNRLFTTLLLLRSWMKTIHAINGFASQWQSRVTRHLERPPAVSNWRELMGLTADWNAHPAWQ